MPEDRQPEIFDPSIPLDGDDMSNVEAAPTDVNGALNEILSATTNRQPDTSVKEATPEQKREYAYEKLKGKALNKLQETVLNNPDVQDKVLNTLDLNSKIEEIVEKRLAAREAEVRKTEILRSYSNGDKDVEDLILETLNRDIKESGDYAVDIQKAVNLITSTTLGRVETNKATSNQTKTPSSVTVPQVEDESFRAPGLKTALTQNNSNTYSNY